MYMPPGCLPWDSSAAVLRLCQLRTCYLKDYPQNALHGPNETQPSDHTWDSLLVLPPFLLFHFLFKLLLLLLFSPLLFFFHSLTSSPKFSPVLVLDMNFSILIFLFLFHLDFLISMSHFRFPSIFLLFIPKLALYFLFLSLSFPSFRYCVPLHLCLSYLHGHIGGFKP